LQADNTDDDQRMSRESDGQPTRRAASNRSTGEYDRQNTAGYIAYAYISVL